MPPYILYKSKSSKLLLEWMADGPKDGIYKTSQSGWMETDQFFEWLKAYVNFIRNTLELFGPLVLFLGGHLSHISIPVIDLAIKNGIHIVCLPSHASHAWQPLDVAVYGPPKKCWRKILEKFYKENNCQVLSKFKFSKELGIYIRKLFS